MNFATRSELLATLERRYDTFPLPARGKLVRYQSLSESELADFEMDFLSDEDEDGNRQTDPEKLRRARARLIVLCLVDAAGQRILSDTDSELVHLHFDCGDSTALYDRLREHCGIAKRVQEARRRQEEKKKGSNQTTV